MAQHARPHLETHNRARGHSAVAGAAYRLGLRLYDTLSGQWHDYTKRALGEEIVRAVTIAPVGAPEWATDPQTLWSKVRDAERRKDAQEARDYRIPIPFELNDEQAGDLAEAMARFIVQELHTPVSMGLHRDASIDALGNVKPKHQQGFHAHLYFPTRRLEKIEGEGGQSAWALGAKLTSLSNKNSSGAFVERLNAYWALLSNDFAREAGLVADYDHRSYMRQGIPLIPQPTLGAPAVALERSGFFTRQGDAVREIVVMSEVYKKVHAATLEAQYAQAAKDAAAYVPDAREASVPRLASEGASEEVAPAPLIAPEPRSLVGRFRATIGGGDNSEEQTKNHEAVSLVRVIQNVLHSLARVATALLPFSVERERERAALLEMEHEVAMARELRANARARLKAWEADHPWRIAAAQVMRGAGEQMPDAWRRLKSLVTAHHDEVQALKVAMRSHRSALDTVAERERPLLEQKEVQEGKLKGVVASLVALDRAYASQLLAACKSEERAYVERTVSTEVTALSDPDGERADATSTDDVTGSLSAHRPTLRPRI